MSPDKTTDKSGIRIKRVGPEEETAALPAPTERQPATSRRTGGTRARTSTTGAKTVHTDDPGPVRDDVAPGRQYAAPRETKPFFLTSEFLVTAATIAAVIVAGYLHDDSLNTWRIWLLVTVIASAYVLSRGIAKAGSADRPR